MSSSLSESKLVPFAGAVRAFLDEGFAVTLVSSFLRPNGGTDGVELAFEKKLAIEGCFVIGVFTALVGFVGDRSGRLVIKAFGGLACASFLAITTFGERDRFCNGDMSPVVRG